MSDIRLYVIPTRGQFTNPDTGRLLPQEGAWVTPSTFWHRRLLDGSVVQGQPPAKAASPAPADAATNDAASAIAAVEQTAAAAIEEIASGAGAKASKTKGG